MQPRTIAIALILALCVSVPPAGAWTFVSGQCSSGPVASVQEIQMLEASIANMQTTLSEAIYMVGRNLDETMKQGQAAQDKQFERLEATITTLAQKFFIQQQEAERRKEEGAETMPRAACKEEEVALHKSQLNETTEKLRKGLMATYKQYASSHTRHTSPYGNAAAIDRDLVDLFPEGGALNDEQLRELTEAMSYMADPVPSLQLTEQQESLAAAEEYKASEVKRDLYLETVRNVFGRHEAMLASKIEDPEVIESLQDMYKSYGNGNAAPQIKDGAISQFGFLDFNANLRYASPNWFSDIRKTRSMRRLLREQALMQALQLKISWEHLQEQKMQTMLLAQRQADVISKEKQSVNSFYRQRFNSSNQ